MHHYLDQRTAFTLKHPFHSGDSRMVRAWYEHNRRMSVEQICRHNPVILKRSRELARNMKRHRQLAVQRRVWFAVHRRATIETFHEITVAERKRRILTAVAYRSGLTVPEICGQGRKAVMVHWRKIAVYVLRRHTGASVSLIGRWLSKDHSTIIHSLKRVEAEPARYGGDIARIEASL